MSDNHSAGRAKEWPVMRKTAFAIAMGSVIVTWNEYTYYAARAAQTTTPS